jgi:hypothetical protein
LTYRPLLSYVSQGKRPLTVEKKDEQFRWNAERQKVVDVPCRGKESGAGESIQTPFFASS